MTWAPVTLEHVRALISQARMDRAADADSEGQLDSYFQLYHQGTVASIRSQLSQSHTLDANPVLLPPEFVILAALRIARILLGRPGPTGAEGQEPFSLTSGQQREMDRLEEQLSAAADGAPITATDNPATTSEATNAAPSPSIVERDRRWTRTKQDGFGAY